MLDLFDGVFKSDKEKKAEIRKAFKYVKPDDEFIKKVFRSGGLQSERIDVHYLTKSISVMGDDIRKYFTIDNDFEVYSSYNSTKCLPEESAIMQKGLAKIYGKKYVRACAKFEQAKLDERKKELDEDQSELDSRIAELNKIAESIVE